MILPIFIGMTGEQWLPFKVLEHSIETTTSQDVAVVPLHWYKDLIPTSAPGARPATPFSFQRFIIPHVCNWKGRALYLDSDMLVLSDISELFKMPFSGAQVLSPPPDKRVAQFAVAMFNCETCNWNAQTLINRVKSGKLSYSELMSFSFCKVDARIPQTWNSLDKWNGEVKLLHYTNMSRQPWLKKGHPFQKIWFKALHTAIAAGKLTKDDIKWQIRLGHVRKTILADLEKFA